MIFGRLCFFILIFSSSLAGAAVKLTPQIVVNQVLERGYQTKSIEYTAQRSYLELERAKSVYDLNLKITPGYEVSEAENLSGTANPIDRTYTLGVSITKLFPTGTTLLLGYDALQQNSVLSSSVTATRQPTAAQDVGTLQIRQQLGRNIFGYSDRLNVEINAAKVYLAEETREENLEELLLTTMTQFWDAYTAQEQLKQNIAAREKYQQLVSNVRRKAGFNLSSPGELPRLEAELTAAEARVKQSSSGFLNSLDKLLMTIRMDTKESVEFEIPQELPPLPKLSERRVEELRSFRVASTTLENARRSKDYYKSLGIPKIDLIARAKSTGVDPATDKSRAEMVAGTHPTYYIGLEIETALDSSLVRGQLADSEVQVLAAETDLRIAQDRVRDQLSSVERLVASNFAAAQSAGEVVTFREKVVREIEISYRQGRQPLVELIRSYNELFSSQLERAKAIGAYHISLNQLAAARDELVTNKN